MNDETYTPDTPQTTPSPAMTASDTPASPAVVPNPPSNASLSITMNLPKNGVATAGGVLGIVGAVLSLIPVAGIFIGIPLGIIAVILSGVGLARSSSTGRGMAITGLILGLLTIIFKLIPGINMI